jgi:hypothetical protein
MHNSIIPKSTTRLFAEAVGFQRRDAIGIVALSASTMGGAS